ncbi:DUF4435 domain-containing protein [Enterobacter kobei]
MVDTNLQLLDSLRMAQSTKDSLMQTVLMALSKCQSIIVFEGDTDYQVYDEWLKDTPKYRSSEHICAKGKSQLIELYKHAIDINHVELINCCKFFVDHDYDLISYNDNCITTLNCYSVENYLVNVDAISNILKDEIHLDGRKIIERNLLIEHFLEDLAVFNEMAKELCLPLFLKHNIEGRARFYNKISDLIVIEYQNVRLKDNASDSMPDIVPSEEVNRLKAEFERLPYERSIRGKYHFEFVKKWLVSLREVINSEQLLDIPRVSKDPAQMDMRRFASATIAPQELMNSECLRH